MKKNIQNSFGVAAVKCKKFCCIPCKSASDCIAKYK